VTQASPLRARRVVEVLATSAGGVGTHVRSIVPVLREAGARVQVCGAPATEELFGFTDAGAEFTPVGITAGLRPIADSRAVVQLRRVLAGADLVHAHGLRAGLVAATARRLGGGRTAPLVLTLHNALLEDGGRLHSALQAVERLTIRSADLVLAVSSDLAANARRAGALDVRLTPVFAPPRPPAVRSRDDVRRELGVADGRPLVVAIARLHPQKGYDVLLDAVAGWATHDSLPTTPLVAIAGDGPLHDELAGRIRAERLPVVLLGRRDDVADLLGAADVCVLPSRWEGTPLIAQEVLRAGRPLVATRTGGVPELVGGGAALVPVGDARALSDALIRVLTDPAHAAELVAAGRAQAAGWPDEEGAGRRIVAVYRELLGPPPDGP
jgi:glycosyltransferase involved in cell wall biosynthesis